MTTVIKSQLKKNAVMSDKIIVPRYSNGLGGWRTDIWTYQSVFEKYNVAVSVSESHEGFDVRLFCQPNRNIHDTLIENIRASISSTPIYRHDLVEQSFKCDTLDDCIYIASKNRFDEPWFDTFISEDSLDEFLKKNRDGQDADPDLAEVVHRSATKLGWLPSNSTWEPVHNRRKYQYNRGEPTTRKAIEILCVELDDFYEDGTSCFVVDDIYEDQRSFKDHIEAQQYAEELSQRYGVSIKWFG